MSQPNFEPVFGPNGAVMNAPSMTPSMRAKLERASRLPTGKELQAEFGSFALIGTVAMTGALNGDSAVQLLNASPWWAGAFAGAIVTITLAVVWRTISRIASRWEVRRGQTAQRTLQVPEWGRWSFVALDSAAVLGYSVLLAGMLTDLGRQYWAIWSSSGFAAGVIASLGLALRWHAEKRGWKWRLETD